MTKFETTGERLTVGGSSKRNQDDHLARYEFMESRVKGKSVLDIACGTGYGCKMMKDYGARHVTGIDISEESVDFAQKNYASEDIKFIQGAAGKKLMDTESVDIVVSFETIEHLEKEERAEYLENLFEYLKPDGYLVLSTPNKLITSPWSKKPLNPYHILEFYKKDLIQELRVAEFKNIDWYGQRFVNRIFTYRLVYLMIRVVEKTLKHDFGIYQHANGPDVLPWKKHWFSVPRYFVVVISKNS